MRILLVGMGGCGRNWAGRALRQVEGAELAGCVDIDPRALELARAQVGIGQDICFTSLDEALAVTEADATLVATTLPGHVPVARAALDAGKHVLTEKPFAPSEAEARELVELAAERGLVLMVSQNYRFFPAVRAVTDLVRRGELGALRQVDVDFRHYSGPGPGGARSRHHLLHHPLLEDMSIHHFDLMRLVLGREPVQVSCWAWNPSWSWFEGPPVAVATIVFHDELLVSYRGSWVSNGPATPWAGEWRMGFEQGEVRWTSRGLMDDASVDRVTVQRTGGPAHELDLPLVPLVDRAGSLAEFIAAIEGRREPESSGKRNLLSLGLMHAAMSSAAAGGRWLQVSPD